jgi:predicted TIM-barrel fold metal-dependent hydrolase
MYKTVETESSRIHDRLSHPVIDCDAHWIQPIPILASYIEKVGGPSAADAWLSRSTIGRWYEATPEERREKGMSRSFWNFPAGTLDRATAMAPGLMYQRLDEFGLDYSVVLPSGGSGGVMSNDPKLRRTWTRALNIMSAELFEPYADRMTPAMMIPTVTPEEAIEELEFCVKELGLKAAQMDGTIRRPLQPGANGDDSKAYFIDALALDSPYDYEPFWQALVDQGVVPLTHTGAVGWPDRSSPSNFGYNHAGHFAEHAHAFARAIFLGGVVKRFPSLKIGFLECGLSVGRSLCTNLRMEWEKRNGDALLEHLKPTNIDKDELLSLLAEYGGEPYREHASEFLDNLYLQAPGWSLEALTDCEEGQQIDDYAAAGVTSKQQLEAEFAKNFFWGCEADDPLTALAFDERLGAKLKPILGSDISHWDVQDMTTVLEEAWELVDDELLTADEFREFTFSNPIEMHCSMNPDFFKGTVVETAVREELARLDSAATPPPRNAA